MEWWQNGQNIFEQKDILTKKEQSSQNGHNNEPQKASYWDHSGVVEDHDGVHLEAGVCESVIYSAHHIINRLWGIEQTQECEQNCSDQGLLHDVTMPW